MPSLSYSSPLAGILCRFYGQGINFLNQHKQTEVALADSFFYNRAQPASERKGDLSRFVHRVAFNNFTILQTAFTAVNVFLAIYSTQQIALASGYPLVQENNKTFSETYHPLAVLKTYLPAAVLTLIQLSISRRFCLKSMQKKGPHKSGTQILSGALHLTGTVQAFVLAALTENKISLLMRAALNGYNLYKNNQLNWIFVKESQNFPPKEVEPRINRLDADYSALLYFKKDRDNKCVICQDEEEVADQVFCTNGHAFHRECLEEHIKSNKEQLLQVDKCNRTDTRNYTNGVYQGTTYSYKVNIDGKKLPRCPTCREYPPQHGLAITVHDQDKGTFPASVNIQEVKPKNHQRTFEKLYAIYNVFQASLSLLQQIPEFTGEVTLLRRFLIVPDVGMGLIAQHYLLNNLEEKRKNSCLGIVFPLLTAIPLFLGLEHFFNPKGGSSLPNVTAQWERPFYERVHRAFDAYRFLVTLGLTRFSKGNKSYNLISFLSQGVGLLNAMNVNWLRVDQKLQRKRNWEGVFINGIFKPNKIKMGIITKKLSNYAIVPSTLSKTTKGVKKAITYIAEIQKRNWNWNPSHFLERENIQDLREYLFKPFIWEWDSTQNE